MHGDEIDREIDDAIDDELFRIIIQGHLKRQQALIHDLEDSVERHTGRITMYEDPEYANKRVARILQGHLRETLHRLKPPASRDLRGNPEQQ